jgi:hypothetical protein
VTRRSRTRGSGGEHEVDRRREPAGPPSLVEDVGDGGGADRTARKGFGERRIEGGRADLIEQAQQVGGLAGERLAPDGEGVEERVGVRAALPEPVPAAEVVRGLRNAQLVTMFTIFPSTVTTRRIVLPVV